MSLENIVKIGTPTPSPRPGELDPDKIEFGRTYAPLGLFRSYENGSWKATQIDSVGTINLHPAAIVFHYGQSIFEGLKAYKWKDGSVNLFRPIENACRLNNSATRMAMPTLDEKEFVEGIRSLVAKQREWIPEYPGSLYIRPSMIGTEPCIGVRAAHEFLFFVIVMPSGAYFPKIDGKTDNMIKVLISTKVGRASHGGTGNVKATANYAVTLKIIGEGKEKGCAQVLFLDTEGKRNIEEMGGMNIFFIAGKKLITPALNDTILPGITRDSIIKLAPTLGYEVEEAKLNIDDICTRIKKGEITEAFACGTAAVIAGIKSFLLDSGETITVGNAQQGEVSSNLYDRLTGIQYGKYPDPFGWIVKV
jgi:branched-chain amino acid aminotransferase